MIDFQKIGDVLMMRRPDILFPQGMWGEWEPVNLSMLSEEELELLILLQSNQVPESPKTRVMTEAVVAMQ